MPNDHSIQEIIQVEIASLKRILGIQSDIVFITDHREWKRLFAKKK